MTARLTWMLLIAVGVLGPPSTASSHWRRPS
jgi:hypothetical protein